MLVVWKFLKNSRLITATKKSVSYSKKTIGWNQYQPTNRKYFGDVLYLRKTFFLSFNSFRSGKILWNFDEKPKKRHTYIWLTWGFPTPFPPPLSLMRFCWTLLPSILTYIINDRLLWRKIAKKNADADSSQKLFYKVIA